MPLLALVFLIKQHWLRRGILIVAMLAVVLFQPITLRPLLSGVQWLRHFDLLAVAQATVGATGWRQHIGNYIQFFLAGILLADVYVVSWKSKPAAQGWGDVVWLLGWPALFWSLLMQDHLVARLVFPVLIFLLYLALFNGAVARRAMSQPVIATIGGMCYSIYLLHLHVILLTGLLLRTILRLPYALQISIAMLVMLPLVLLICGAFYRLIERPCMRRDWPKRVWNIVFVQTEPTPEN